MLGFALLRGCWIRLPPPPLAPLAPPLPVHCMVLYCFAMRWIELHCTAVDCTPQWIALRCLRSCRVSRLVVFLGASRPIVSRRGTLRVTLGSSRGCVTPPHLVSCYIACHQQACFVDVSGMKLGY